MIRKRAFLGLLLFAWFPFIVRAVQIYVTHELSAGRDARADRRDVPPVPRAAGLLRLHRHDLRRRRADRQRPPRQRAADLPVEAADAHRSTSPARWRSCSRSCCSSRSCRRCCCCSCRCCSPAASSSCRTTCSCSRRSRVGALLQALRRDVHDAGAVVAVEERRYVGILYAGIIFFTAAIYGAMLRDHRQHRAVVAVARREPDAGRRRHLPADAALRHAVAGLAHRHPRARRRCRSRCSSGACAAWRW